MEGKTCTKCGEWKPFDAFHKNARNKTDGYLAKCKQCRSKAKPKREIAEGKVCTKCNEWKPYAEFNKAKTGFNGYRGECKVCSNKKSKQIRENNLDVYREKSRNYYYENRESCLIYSKKYRDSKRDWYREYGKNHYLENKDIYKINREKWIKENREKYEQYHSEYRKNNKELIHELYKKHYQENYEMYYQASVKRRSHKHKVSFSPFQRKQILNRDKWTCQHCGIKVHDDRKRPYTPDKANIDHIIPISKSGNSEPNNLQVLCRTCNIKKKDKIELQLSLF